MGSGSLSPPDLPLVARWHRPPGAIAEALFRDTCGGCCDCVRACPYHAVRRLGSEHGELAGTPAIIPVEAPCYLCADLPCIAACRTGALVPVAVRSVRMGTAVVDRDACRVAIGEACDYCVACCPLTGDAVTFGDDHLPVVHPAACAGCGVCVYECPSDAIAIVSEHNPGVSPR